MNEYILFMHDDTHDAVMANDPQRWEIYLANLRSSGFFDGGSAIGPGTAFKQGHAHKNAEGKVTGYLRVRADNLQAATCFLQGNPTHEAGGTVEIRVLVRD